MTTIQNAPNYRSGWASLAVVLALPLPWLMLRLQGFHGDPFAAVALSGLAILGAAFLLSWAAELWQLDVCQAFVLAVLSLIAILPEYAVDAYFAWQAAREPIYGAYALANMTGANRLLIGVGWALVVVLGAWRLRRRSVRLDRGVQVEVAVLLVATVYALALPFRGSLSLWDTLVLAGLFAFYLIKAARADREDPHLTGPAACIAGLPCSARRLATGALFLYAALAILAATEPFSEGLIASGALLGVDEFLLVQWLAPLASESPEFIIAGLFAWRGQAAVALRLLIASKVNQWTLLVGLLPLVTTVSAGAPMALPLDLRQQHEVLLTAAQSLFAVTLLLRLRLGTPAALLLAVLFFGQLVMPGDEVRLAFSVLYVVMAVGLLMFERGRRAALLLTLRALRPRPVVRSQGN